MSRARLVTAAGTTVPGVTLLGGLCSCGKINCPLSCSPDFGSSFLILETPLSLSQLCRVTVRKAAGQRALEKIAKLNIPPRLIQYLSYN